MRNLLKMCLVAALILTVSGTVQALSLQVGPYFQKTLNYEIGTAYAGGVDGVFYFRDNATSYYTEEHGLLTYGDRASDRLFGDATLSITKAPSLLANEDLFGLLRVTTIANGNISPVDSRFGDGLNATAVGNDITAGPIYWAEQFGHNEVLHGIIHSGADQVIEVIDGSANQYRIWHGGSLFDVWLVDDAAAALEPWDAGLTPASRVGVDQMPGWFDPTQDSLFLSGSLEYFRFEGSTIVNAQGEFIFDGNTEVVGDFATHKVGWADDLLANWWDSPDGTPVPGGFDPTGDMWQSWNIGDPFSFRDGWVGSEDSGRGFVPIPEPVTMLGVCLGLGSLGGYVRKRRGLV
jgi:hypothetical protein